MTTWTLNEYLQLCQPPRSIAAALAQLKEVHSKESEDGLLIVNDRTDWSIWEGANDHVYRDILLGSGETLTDAICEALENLS